MKHILYGLACLSIGAMAGAQLPQITEVTANQFGSFVRIEYDLTGPADVPIAVSVAASNNGGLSFSHPAMTIHGDVGMRQVPGTMKVALWDIGSDLPESVNDTVQIWVKAWIPGGTATPAEAADFAFVHAEVPSVPAINNAVAMPGFYVTPCPISTEETAPSVPQALADAYPDFAFELFRESVTGTPWADLSGRTPWASEALAQCAQAPGWRIAAYYWPSEPSTPLQPDQTLRPWLLAGKPAASSTFATATLLVDRDADGDGIADDKVDWDLDGVLDALHDYDGNGSADAFELRQDGALAAYSGPGADTYTGLRDENNDHVPDFFAARFPITSSSHPRENRVYFNGQFEGTINPYQPGAAGYRWRLSTSATTELNTSDPVLTGAGPHLISVQAGNGIRFLHVAAIDGTGAFMLGSARRFVFNTSLNPPFLHSYTHSDSGSSSDVRVFTASVRMGYGPRAWRAETVDPDSKSKMLHFANQMWFLQPDGDVWSSLNGLEWKATTLDAPWSITTDESDGAAQLSAAVFQGKMWVYASYVDVDFDRWPDPWTVAGGLWSSGDGVHWDAAANAPWPLREGPSLVAFQDALYLFGGLSYTGNLPDMTNPVWRTEDGMVWSKIADDVAWDAKRNPNIFVFGDSLWLDAPGEYYATLASGPYPYRSWDGVHWQYAGPSVMDQKSETALESSTTNKIDVSDVIPFFQGDWYGWNELRWRYLIAPWDPGLLPFHERLWKSGPEMYPPLEFEGAGSIWRISAEEVFAPVLRYNPIDNLESAAAISAFGDIQVIGRLPYQPFYSAYGDRWFFANTGDMKGEGLQLTTLNGEVWGADEAYVKRLDEDGTVHRTYRTGRAQPGFATYQGKLWLLGGRAGGYEYASDVLFSEDGVDWSTATSTAPWGPRKGAKAVAFGGALWLLGGTDNAKGLRNDVWRSTDGVAWTQILAEAPWAPREIGSLLVHDGALWVVGGNVQEPFSDAWYSVDGITWVEDRSGIGPGTFHEGVAVDHQDSLFLLSADESGTVLPTRRRGRAYVPADSFQGIRYIIDQSPDTVPGAGVPVQPALSVEVDSLDPGEYWLHLAAVDTRGTASPVVHRKFAFSRMAAPTVELSGLSEEGTIPANRFGVSAQNPWGTQHLYGLNQAPGGLIEFPLPPELPLLPCLEQGTYWLAVQAMDLYGFRSERFEQAITISAPVPAIPPQIDFTGVSASAETRLPRAPGDAPVIVTPAAWSGVPIRYVVDQRYGFATDFSGAMESETKDFVLPGLGVGRHFVHAHATDSCGLPSEEATHTTFVRRRMAPVLSLESADTPGALRISWTEDHIDGLSYRFVVDEQPNTLPNELSEVTTSPSLDLSIPEGVWSASVHVCIVDPTGDISDPGHMQLSGDETGILGLWGPRQTGATVQYRAMSPAAGELNVDASQVIVQSEGEGWEVNAQVLTPSASRSYSLISVTRAGDGPFTIALPLGCVLLNETPLPASGTSATGIIDATPPVMSLSAPIAVSGPEPGLRFDISVSGAEDFYLWPGLFSLEHFPALPAGFAPRVTYAEGLWQAFFPGASATGAIRLKLPSIDPISTAPLPYRCVGYDRAGNCVEAINTPWFDLGDADPVVSLEAPASAFLKNGAVFTLRLSEPVNHYLDPSGLLLLSDPPGGATASYTLTPVDVTTSRITLSGVTGDGQVQLVAPAGYVVDPVGNPSAEALSEARTVDNTPPSIVFGQPVYPAILGDPIVLPFEIAGAAPTPSPTLRMQRPQGVASSLSLVFVEAEDDVQRYEVHLVDYTGFGEITVSVTGTSVGDLAGNKAVTTASGPISVAIHAVTLETAGMGTTDPPPGVHRVSPGTLMQLRAIPGNSVRFLGWSLGGSQQSALETSYLVNKNVTLKATFSQGAVHRTDADADNRISLSELLRIIQFYNAGGLHCAVVPSSTEDGYVPVPGLDHSCAYHDSDYSPSDWVIRLSELLRMIQFYNIGSYGACDEGEDGFCPGAPPGLAP